MDLGGGDLGPSKQPAEVTAESEKAKVKNEKENRKKSKKEEVKNKKEIRKKVEKEKVKNEKEIRKKSEKEKVKDEKENRKERKSGGWRATLLKCFVCGGGGDSQDEWEMSAEERLRIQERIRRAREADLQRSLKMREDNLMRKEKFKRILRARKLTEANKEWSALPARPEEEADRKVTFLEVDACDVWFYQEEANPRLGQVWRKVLCEIKDNKMARDLQAKWPRKKKQLMKREEKQVIIAPKKQEEEMDLCDALTGYILCLGFGALLCLWLSHLL